MKFLVYMLTQYLGEDIVGSQYGYGPFLYPEFSSDGCLQLVWHIDLCWNDDSCGRLKSRRFRFDEVSMSYSERDLSLTVVQNYKD